MPWRWPPPTEVAGCWGTDRGRTTAHRRVHDYPPSVSHAAARSTWRSATPALRPAIRSFCGMSHAARVSESVARSTAAVGGESRSSAMPAGDSCSLSRWRKVGTFWLTRGCATRPDSEYNGNQTVSGEWKMGTGSEPQHVTNLREEQHRLGACPLFPRGPKSPPEDGDRRRRQRAKARKKQNLDGACPRFRAPALTV